jgi:hypothetical protein
MKGYNALDCAMISRGSAGARLGRYTKLCFLPDKAARFLFKFHADDYKTLRLPAIQGSASSGDIHNLNHKLLKTHHVCIHKTSKII